MNKIIYAVEYNPVKSSEQTFTKKRILEETYEHDITGEEVTVNSIQEQIINSQRTIMVYYTNGQDDEIFDIYQIYRRLK